MTNEPSHPSRRRFLGAATGTAVTVATAGCLSSLVGSSSGATTIEPEEPSEPREGTPGEFYYFLEENGIAVDELLEDDDELYLTYRTEAETEEESDEEIMTIYQVYRQALIHRGSEIEFLYAEISNPFDGQAHGWGIDSDWIRDHDTQPDENESDADPDDVDTENETVNDDIDGSDVDGENIDMNEIIIWSNIMNSKVYAEDLENGGAADHDPEDVPEPEPEDEDKNDTES